MVNEYTKFYNYSAKFQPSLPDKYRKHANPSELYTKWITSGKRTPENIPALCAFNAIKDACSNYKASRDNNGIISQMNTPNIIKFEKQQYKIVKLKDNYGVQIGTRKNGIFLPLKVGNYVSLKNHLDAVINSELLIKNIDNNDENKKVIKKSLKVTGAIVYNLRDNSVSIPIITRTDKFKKVKEINTYIWSGFRRE